MPISAGKKSCTCIYRLVSRGINEKGTLKNRPFEFSVLQNWLTLFYDMGKRVGHAGAGAFQAGGQITGRSRKVI